MDIYPFIKWPGIINHNNKLYSMFGKGTLVINKCNCWHDSVPNSVWGLNISGYLKEKIISEFTDVK